MGKHSSGLFFGLLTGAVLGILFAPKKGRDLREQIKQERDEGGTGVGALKDSFVGMGKDLAGTAKEVYETDTVQENLFKAKKKAGEIAEMGKEKMGKAAKHAVRKAKKMGKKATNFTKKKIGR
ncbi:YtxH domain-containing protein [Candidatus Peregrinibacteria bacterium]|nr:YtxH domain-containing protein [Candidatus Peregrinibacteria bacterium]